MGAFYWERHPEMPFVTLITVAATNCSPDAFDGAYPDLISRARTPDPDDEEIRTFAAELRQALADPGQLPGDELSAAVEYTTAATRRSCAACGMTCTATSRPQGPILIVPWMRRPAKTWPGGCTACSSASMTGWAAKTHGSCTTSSK